MNQNGFSLYDIIIFQEVITVSLKENVENFSE